MPTIPSRDQAPVRKPFTRSPGRAYSMSRLDQLARPRKRPTELPAVAETARPQTLRPLSRPQQSSVSRSMSHLAVSKPAPAQSSPQRPLRKSSSRSMHQLSVAGTVPPPRPNRATQLRQQKLAGTATSSEGNFDGRQSHNSRNEYKITIFAVTLNELCKNLIIYPKCKSKPHAFMVHKCRNCVNP